MTPLITILIDTYNHERYIEQTVVSAIEQDFPSADFEIVVVDDGSTDRTPEIVRKFAPRARLLRKKNGGQASAFNAGFTQAHGRLIAFLDGDDWWAKDKLAKVFNAFERDPDCAAVSHAYYEFHESGCKKVLHSPPEEEVLNLSTPESADLAREHWHLLLPCALTVRRELLERVLPIPEVLVFSADGPIAAMAMAMGVRVLPEALAYYRVHPGNLNAVDERDTIKTRRKYEMGAAMYEIVERLLIERGIPSECVATLLDRPIVHVNRFILSSFGGSRITTLKTELRSFRCGPKSRTLRDRLLKYPAVAVASLLLSPRQFYRMRVWYGRQTLERIRNLVYKTGETKGKLP